LSRRIAFNYLRVCGCESRIAKVKYGLIENPVCNPVNGGCDHQACRSFQFEANFGGSE
jgi:hypothetical protein